MVPVVLKIIVPQAECHVKKILALCFIGLRSLKKKEGERMFNKLKRFKFYNYETGKEYPFWFGIACHATAFLCCMTGIVVIMIGVCII